MHSILSLRIFTSRPGSHLRFFIEMQIKYYFNINSTLLYSSIIRLYPQNSVFEIVHDESVNVYLHMYTGNVQHNSLCVESCVTKEFSMSPRFSSTIFDPDANSVHLREHLCTAVDSMRRKPCVRNCSRKREGLHNGNAQQNPLCAASCVTTPTSTFLYSGASRLYAQNPVFEIVHDEGVKVYLYIYNGNVQQNPLCVEPCVTEEFSISPRFSPMIFDPHANSVLLRAHLCTAAADSTMRR